MAAEFRLPVHDSRNTGQSMSSAPETQIIGVFQDRDRLERAIETLQSRGLERGQLSVLGTADAVRGRLGLARRRCGREWCDQDGRAGG